MPSFLTLTDVAEQLNISVGQARSMVRSGELESMQIGGRGQYRVEEAKLNDYIQRKHEEQRAKIEARQRSAQATVDAD